MVSAQTGVISDLRDLFPNARRSGGIVWIFCKYHGDRERPNMAVYADHAHCYACNKHLTAVEFVREMGRRDIRVDLTARPEEEGPQKKLQAGVPFPLVRKWATNLQTSPAKLEWLQKRGLSRQVIEECQLGYTGTAYSIPYLDRYTDLILRTEQVRVDGVKFRRDDEISKEGPKYWQLSGASVRWYPETPDVNRARIWLVEGELDALLLRSEGEVAYTMTAGASTVSTKLVKDLEGYQGKVLVVYDVDAPGLEGATRLVSRIKKKVASVERVLWPIEMGKDITERYQAIGPEEFKRWLESLT